MQLLNSHNIIVTRYDTFGHCDQTLNSLLGFIIIVGGLNYDLTEGDVLAVFSQ